ncbi:hypothetical protein Scel_24260 [Streptomyces cellostaticus]|nr:hypothetical protein Scel_24260 [Streptomyces cellostaticus]
MAPVGRYGDEWPEEHTREGGGAGTQARGSRAVAQVQEQEREHHPGRLAAESVDGVDAPQDGDVTSAARAGPGLRREGSGEGRGRIVVVGTLR